MSDNDAAGLLLWADVETTGLGNPRDEYLLEIGLVVTDLDLEVVDTKSWIPTFEGMYDKTYVSRVVVDMHTKNGLLKEYAKAWEWGVNESRRDLEREVYAFIKKHFGTSKPPLCGSTVYFDKGYFTHHFPALVINLLSHRVIDVSSLKEICKRYRPDLYEKIKQDVNPQGRHRVIPDILDSINEFRFYKKHLLGV